MSSWRGHILARATRSAKTLARATAEALTRATRPAAWSWRKQGTEQVLLRRGRALACSSQAEALAVARWREAMARATGSAETLSRATRLAAWSWRERGSQQVLLRRGQVLACDESAA